MPSLSPRDLPDPGVEPTSPALAGRPFTTEPFITGNVGSGRENGNESECTKKCNGQVTWGWGRLGSMSDCPALRAGALTTCDVILLPDKTGQAAVSSRAPGNTCFRERTFWVT